MARVEIPLTVLDLFGTPLVGASVQAQRPRRSGGSGPYAWRDSAQVLAAWRATGRSPQRSRSERALREAADAPDFLPAWLTD